MTIDDLKRLAEIWRQKDGRNDAKTGMNRIFRNKSCNTVIRELTKLLPQMPGKNQNEAVFIVVLCLLHRNSGQAEEIKRVLLRENLIPHLYGAMRVYLGGRSSTMQLKISWTDARFPNRYDYLKRFAGQFGYWENRDVLYAAEILADVDREKFEKLAFEDTTRLILLNMVSYQFHERPSDELIARLLKDGDELQANIGFYFAVWEVRLDIRSYGELRRNGKKANSKATKEVDERIKRHLEELDTLLKNCTIERRASLLMNYVLCENEYPIRFGHWLMEEQLQQAVLAEMASDKISNLKKLNWIAHLVHDFPCRDANGRCLGKEKYYSAILLVLKRFVKERTGIYQWDERQEAEFLELCRILPKKYRKQLRSLIEKEMEKLMVSKLDELVRYSIYLKDRTQWEICRGMMECVEKGGE